MGIKFYTLALIAKLVSFISKTFKIGSGNTWPGHIAEILYPEILVDPRFSFNKGLIFISGTNGKTTTSKLLTHLLRNAGFSVVSNESGANLINGVVSAFLINFCAFKKYDFGVFELDELNVDLAITHARPDILVLLNLSRDQLDRAGEIDIILDRWIKSFPLLEEKGTTLIYDSTDPHFANFSDYFQGEKLTFMENSDYLKLSNLQGAHNAKNSHAAVVAAKKIGLPEEAIRQGLPMFEPAFGRGEVLSFAGAKVSVLLAKNPASLTTNLNYLATIINSVTYDPKNDAKEITDEEITHAGKKPGSVVLMLNDNIPDGRDVSWIYDVLPESFAQALLAIPQDQIYVSGTRAFDMAVRLGYAGIKVNKKNIISDISEVLRIATAGEESQKNGVLVLPNYSAMLETRKVLTGRSIL